MPDYASSYTCGYVPSTRFLVFDEALRTHETLTPLGFVLRNACRPRRSGEYISVRMIWRRPEDRESVVLTLRLRVGGKARS
jgi:hypothetical protein